LGIRLVERRILAVLRNRTNVAREVADVVQRTQLIVDHGAIVEVPIELTGRESQCESRSRRVALQTVRATGVVVLLHARSAGLAPGPVGLGHRVFRSASERLERRWLPRFSSVLVTSEHDAGVVRAIAPEANLRVYPNAIPLTPMPPPATDEAIVFSGNMQYHPNRSAVRHFHSSVWPILRARFPGLVWRLVGKNPDAIRSYVARDPRIAVTGAVENAVAEIARSRIAVVPLLSGSGTRLKILEAWAAGVPVVSTTIGAEGLPVRDGEHLLIADGAESFADSVTRLLECTGLRQSVRFAGRLLMEKEFTWETAWAKLDF
jgi:glycosyltransferase involved in cell wall biosynthesis